MMLGIRVLQVYGLTETTAICTMDDPAHIDPGRVGPAIPGIEMKLGEKTRFSCAGRIFSRVIGGVRSKPPRCCATDGFTRAIRASGRAGNWRITGRLKNLMILSSGHNIAPEPIEEELVRAMRGAQHVVLVGNGRSFLVAIVTGEVADAEIDRNCSGSTLHCRTTGRFALFMRRERAFDD